MNRRKRTGIWFVGVGAAAGLVILAAGSVLAEGPATDSLPGTSEARSAAPAWGVAADRVRHLVPRLLDWYARTPPGERVTWGGLVACGGVGLIVLVERTWRLRERRVVPPAFTERFVDHLHDGRLDGGQALDHCERNPSPAARVALAAVRRWGRPAGDLERAVAMAHRVEAEGLRRNVGTLRRVAVLAAMLGILGTLSALGRALETLPATATGPGASRGAWGPAVAGAIAPMSTGLIIATLALVAYDGVLARVEKLAGALDRLGAETIEAIAMSLPPAATPIAMARSPHSAGPVREQASPGARHRT